MACTVTLADISYSCDDVAIGGIIELHIMNSEAVRLHGIKNGFKHTLCCRIQRIIRIAVFDGREHQFPLM